MAIAPAAQVARTGSSPASTARPHDNILRQPRCQAPIRRLFTGAVRFAHPAERHIAGLFDAHGVRWQYEPTTFPLITSLAGEPVQSFTPDFYLPDYDTYLEMTTMRQSLVTRKNRKFRLMRESYPEIDVRLVYRKDVELIVGWYATQPDPADVLLGPTFASPDQVARKVHDVAAYLHSLGPVALVAVAESANWFRDALADHLNAAGEPMLAGSLDLALSGGDGRPVVLVADIVGTGLTVDAALRACRASGVPVETVVTLLDRRSARLVDVPLGVPGLPAPSAWIAGCGLGPAGYASRPDLTILARRPEA